MRRALSIVVVSVAVGLLLAAARSDSGQAGAGGALELLPDLAQDVPTLIAVQRVPGPEGVEFRLGFRSAFRNVGDGPLIIRGSRDSPEAPMRADQIVRLSGGGSTRFRDVIPMRYVYSETHDHFHVLRIDTYSLRDAATGARVRPDNKSGFCVGDRQEVDRPRVHPPPYYGPATGECERGNPSATRVLEGLTQGWLDDYGPQLEGQYIDITGLSAGRYSLVHRVNATQQIRERNSRNNVASALIEIAWPAGPDQAPQLSVLATCTKSARCPAPERSARPRRVPVLTTSETRRFRLSCSLLRPADELAPAARRARRARIATSRRAWLSAVQRAASRDVE